MVDDELATLLAEQLAYYRVLAPEYLDGGLDFPAATDDLEAALDAFAPGGDVLELARGPGTWTPRLLRYAASVTGVDASPEMLALARERVGVEDRVRFVCADLFAWRPERRYEVVFFGFWLSHVPLERFAAFWALVADCLTPDGRVFFVDDAYRTPDELIDGEASAIIRRRLNASRTALPTEPSRFPTRRLDSNGALPSSAGISGSRGPRDRSSGWLADRRSGRCAPLSHRPAHALGAGPALSRRRPADVSIPKAIRPVVAGR